MSYCDILRDSLRKQLDCIANNEEKDFHLGAEGKVQGIIYQILYCKFPSNFSKKIKFQHNIIGNFDTLEKFDGNLQ
jgi:hypothetical protein